MKTYTLDFDATYRTFVADEYEFDIVEDTNGFVVSVKEESNIGYDCEVMKDISGEGSTIVEAFQDFGAAMLEHGIVELNCYDVFVKEEE